MIKNKRKLRFSKGLTVVELMISIAVLLMILTLVTNMIFSTARTQSRVRMENHMRGSVQTALFRLSAQLNQTRMIMENNTLGYDYLNKLNFNGAPPVVGSSPSTVLSLSHTATSKHLLPSIMPAGSLSPEKDCTNYPNNFFRSNSVGNMLLFSQYLGKYSRFAIAAATDKRSIDLYAFKLYYLTDDNNLPAKNVLDFWSNTPTKRALRLIEWTSQPYADYDQLLSYVTDSVFAT